MLQPTLQPSPIVKGKQKVLQENRDVTTFRGLNRMPSIEKGELRSMQNLSSDNPTCLSPRKPRQSYRTLSSGTALFAVNNGKLCWVDGTTFYYDGTSKGTVTTGAKSICQFSSNIFIFPDKKYYNYETNTFADIATGTYSIENQTGCPDMKCVCTYAGRVWGISDDTLYASKLYDPFSWTYISNPQTASDSYYLELFDVGVLTSIIPLENHIVFTSKHSIYELYGNSPLSFEPRLITNSSGCIDNKSMIEMDGRVLMLERDGINIYGGSFPQPISLKLQEKNCVSGVGVIFDRKYYISLYNGTDYSLYMYDTLLQQWYVEDSLHVLDFAVSDNKLYALASNSVIYMFNYSSGTAVLWSAELDRFTLQYLGQKATNKIKIEVELESGSSMNAYIRTDGSDYRLLGTDSAAGYHYYPVFELPRSAFWAQLKLTGIGNCKVYSVTREIIVNSDVE